MVASCEVWNTYGPTEATVVSTNAPAGKPIGWQDGADWQANLTLLKETGGIPEIKPLSAYYSNDYLQ